MAKLSRTNRLSIVTLLFSLAVLAITLALFSKVLSADFVMWDDDINVYRNPNLRELGLQSIHWAFTDVYTTSRYIPFTLLGWSAVFSLFGLNPFGYHLANWILHGLSSVVFFLIINKILVICQINSRTDECRLHSISIAFFAALIWAIHPLRVEPVAWVTNLAYCQAIACILISTFLYLEAQTLSPHRLKYKSMLTAASLVFYLISLLSQVIGVTYFAVYIILDIYLLKRFGGNIEWWKSQETIPIVKEKILFAVPALLLLFINLIARMASAKVWGPPAPLADFGIIDRALQASYLLAYHTWRPFYPLHLSPLYTVLISFDPLSLPFISSAFCVLAVSTVVFIFRKQWPWAFALLLAHIILLIPVLGLLEHPYFPSDRYSLVSSLCLSILVALLLFRLKNRPTLFKLAAIPLVAIVIILGALTYRQTTIWKNSETLFTHMIKSLGGDPYRQKMHNRMGVYFMEIGSKEKAVSSFRLSLEINPLNSYGLFARRCLDSLADVKR